MFVVIDAGEFDIPISHFKTGIGSKHYIDLVQPKCKLPLVEKSKEQLRELKEIYEVEDILTGFED